MLNHRARRRGQEGQALIMALAFIAFFGLVTTAVLQFADGVELQQSRTRSSATTNADANSGILFAAEAEAQAALVPEATCMATVQPVSISVSAGRKVNYSIPPCTQSTIDPCWQYADITVNEGSSVIGRGQVLWNGCPAGTITTGLISINYGP